METVSFKIAQQLKQAGFPQDSSLCAWAVDKRFKDPIFCLGKMTFSGERNETFAAPTADEIIRLLPIRVVPFKRRDYDKDLYHDLQISRNLYYYEIDYRNEYELPTGCFNKSYFKYGMKNKVLANVCAEMWLHLKKEGYFDENREHALFVDKSYDKKVKP